MLMIASLLMSADFVTGPLVMALAILAVVSLMTLGITDPEITNEQVQEALLRGKDDLQRFNPTKVERKELRFEILHPHPKNPRKAKRFEKDSAVYQSLNASYDAAGGWIPGNDIVVRPHPTIPGEYQILKGHRRTKVAVDRGIYHIPCIILHGIGDREALSIVLDQDTVLGLDEEERLNSVRAMVAESYSRSRMMAILNCDNNQIQKYLNMLLLPPKVTEQWLRTEIDGRGEKILKELEINPIKKNLDALVAAVKEDADNPNFVGLPEEGPKYKEMYASLVDAKRNPPKSNDRDVYNPADIKRIVGTRHRRWVRALLARLVGQRLDSLDDILARLEWAHDFVSAYADGKPLPIDEAMLNDFRTVPTITPIPSEPAPVEGASEPAPVEGASEPAPVEGASEPAPVEGASEPAPVEGASEPAPVEGASEPAPADTVPVRSRRNGKKVH
jgi:ParB-like chromosome segregation protein Spo0J